MVVRGASDKLSSVERTDIAGIVAGNGLQHYMFAKAGATWLFVQAKDKYASKRLRLPEGATCDFMVFAKKGSVEEKVTRTLASAADAASFVTGTLRATRYSADGEAILTFDDACEQLKGMRAEESDVFEGQLQAPQEAEDADAALRMRVHHAGGADGVAPDALGQPGHHDGGEQHQGPVRGLAHGRRHGPARVRPGRHHRRPDAR